MRKLNILKAIVDYVCITSYIIIPVLIALFGYLIIIEEPIDIPFKINGSEVTIVDLPSKLLLFFLLISFFLVLYSIFLFRKILSSFQKTIIFDVNVIKNFKNIGILLLVSSFLYEIPILIYHFIHKKINFEIGINSFIILFVLGLFSMVLSEVFIIAKKQKEENELTI